MVNGSRILFRLIPLLILALSLALAIVAYAAPIQGQLWIGTFGYGLNCLDRSGWHTYLRGSSSLPSNQIKDLAVTNDGQLWVVHSLGLSRVQAGSWQNFSNSLWGYGSPEAVAVDGANGIWLAYFGGVGHYDGVKWQTYEAAKLGSGTNARLVRAISVAGDGKVWVATANSLACFDGQNWSFFEKGRGWDKEYFFTDIAVDRANRVWAGHSNGLLSFQGGKWIPYENAQLSQVKCLAPDTEGRLWAGTYAKGLSLVVNGKMSVTYSRGNSKISSDSLSAAAVDAGGRVWCGTQYGLSIFGGGQWQAYYMHNSGLADNELYALAITGDGPDLPPPQAKAAGSLSGSLREGEAPVAGATVELGVEFAGLVFTGASPFGADPFHRLTKTDPQGRFFFNDLPPGRYGLVFKGPDGKWKRLSGAYGISQTKIAVEEGKETVLPAIDLNVK